MIAMTPALSAARRSAPRPRPRACPPAEVTDCLPPTSSCPSRGSPHGRGRLDEARACRSSRGCRGDRRRPAAGWRMPAIEAVDRRPARPWHRRRRARRCGRWPPPLLTEGAEGRPREEERAGEVHGEHLLPLLLGGALEGRQARTPAQFTTCQGGRVPAGPARRPRPRPRRASRRTRTLPPRPPAARIWAAVSSAATRFTSATTTAPPRSARIRAVARPMPTRRP